MTEVLGRPDATGFDHRGAVVSTEADLVSTVRAFLDEEDSADELAIVVVDESSIGRLADALVGRLDRTMLAPAQRLYPGTGQAMFDLWDDVIQEGFLLGYQRVRVVGQPTWFSSGLAPEWCEFEAHANVHFRGWPASALCLLDLREGASVAEPFMRAHPKLADGTPNASFMHAD